MGDAFSDSRRDTVFGKNEDTYYRNLYEEQKLLSDKKDKEILKFSYIKDISDMLFKGEVDEALMSIIKARKEKVF